MRKLFEGVFEGLVGKKKSLFTRNLTPGKAFFQEDLFTEDGVEYRPFEATRSKLAAAIVKGVSEIGFKEGCTVLYLGAASGYTVSFVSDIIREDGMIFAVDFAPRVMRDLYFVSKARTNIAPILADANKPSIYLPLVLSADVVYQDVAQKAQSEIFLKNVELFLKKDGVALLAVKARSIDVTKNPKQVFQEVRRELEDHLRVIDYRVLDPFEKDHAFFVCRRR
jgi:fibrillarin-like pre-rRNA processing protein